MGRLVTVLVCLALALGLAACSSDDGDDDDSAGGDGNGATATTEAASPDTGGDDVDAFDEGLTGSDFEDRLAGIEISLDAEVEIIDETTAEVTIEDGTLDGNAEFDCAAVDAVVEEGETVTLVYPDGETTCDDL